MQPMKLARSPLMLTLIAYLQSGDRPESVGPLPNSRARFYDMAVALVALGAAYGFALMAYDDIAIQSAGNLGRASGGIWKQVMPALYGYGAFAAVMVIGIVVRFSMRTSKR